jgi:hypothetical protein
MAFWTGPCLLRDRVGLSVAARQLSLSFGVFKHDLAQMEILAANPGKNLSH